jgi:predicted ATPase
MLVDHAHGTATPEVSSGYMMIKSLKINNFRSFKKVEISNLKRINVLVGANGSGKTALLESLFLAAGASPELAHRLRLFRGMGTAIEITEGMEAVWKNLFHNFDQRKSISIDITATDMMSRSLEITVSGATEEFRLALQSGRSTVSSPVEFAWTDANGHVFKSRPTIVDGDKLTFPQAKPSSKVAFIPANFRLNPEESAKRLSALTRRNTASDVVDVLSRVYPEVRDVSVENSDGNWEVFVDLENLDERIPLALHSSGASRLVAMMLAITVCQDGFVLIDEIENGFYYKTLGEVWRVLTTLANEFKCQVFASTHSDECLKALGPLVEGDPVSYSLLTVEKKGIESRVTVTSGDVMGSAIGSGFELR